MSTPFDDSGFTPGGRVLGNERRVAALAELVATAALALSTVVAVTAVSVGMARADGIGAAGNSGGHAVALLLGLTAIGAGVYVFGFRRHFIRR